MANDTTTSAPTYQVVGYDDVRGIAVDAADTALSNYQPNVEAVANATAEAAVTASREDIETKQLEIMNETAKQAADSALEGVQVKLDEQTEAIRSAAEVEQSVTVTLTDDQWTFVQDEMRMQSMCQVLTLLLVCCVFGAVVAQFFVMGWRR